MSADYEITRNRFTESEPGFKIENDVIIGRNEPMFKADTNVGELILNRFKSRPDFIGQVDASTERFTTYAEMERKSVKCAIWLRKRGIRSGDIVNVCTYNHLDAYIPCMAALYVGAILNPCIYELDKVSVRHFLSLTEPKVIFTSGEVGKLMSQVSKEELGGSDFNPTIITFEGNSEWISLDEILTSDIRESEIDGFRCTEIRSPRETALLVFSSGSVGLPKGVEIPHENVLGHFKLDRLGMIPGYPSMWHSPLSWISGIIHTLYAFFVYSTRILDPKLDPHQMCRYIQKYNVSYILHGTSTAIYLMKSRVFKRYDLSSLKTYVIGGMKLSGEIVEILAEQLPKTKVVQGYGLSETGAVAMQHPKCNVNSVGFVLPNTSVKIWDVENGKTLNANQEGEICVKSSTCMKGYYRDPETTRQVLDSDGWLHTGDLGYYDEEGNIYIIDRIKEIIKWRSYQISPAEIEALIQRHPGVGEVAVIGVPHYFDGEEPLAIVSKVTEEELIELVAKNLADYKKLRAGVKFVERLPLTSTGKLDRRKLKEMTKSFPINK